MFPNKSKQKDGNAIELGIKVNRDGHGKPWKNIYTNLKKKKKKVKDGFGSNMSFLSLTCGSKTSDQP